MIIFNNNASILTRLTRFKANGDNFRLLQRIFSQNRFLGSFADVPPLHQQNKNHTFISFCGRSNVGKSSLMNAIFGEKKLVKTSKTPGRTQTLNFFRVAKLLYMVDMPGYGYAKAPISVVRDWQQTNQNFLKTQNPHMVYMLVDSRRDRLKLADMKFCKFLISNHIPFTVVYTKVDKKRASLVTLDSDLQKLIKSYWKTVEREGSIIDKDYLNEVDLLETSSRKKINIELIRMHILQSVGIIRVNEEGEYYIARTELVDPLPEMKHVAQQAENEEAQRDENGEDIEQIEETESDEGGVTDKDSSKTIQPPQKRLPAKKKKKTKLRIGEIIKKSSTSHKDIQRTRHLEDGVNRTDKQYKSYQKIHKYKATKHIHKRR